MQRDTASSAQSPKLGTGTSRKTSTQEKVAVSVSVARTLGICQNNHLHPRIFFYHPQVPLESPGYPQIDEFQIQFKPFAGNPGSCHLADHAFPAALSKVAGTAGQDLCWGVYGLWQVSSCSFTSLPVACLVPVVIQAPTIRKM